MTTKKGGAPRGSANGMSRLTEQERAKIRASKLSLMRLAIRYGVDKSTIARVRAK